MKRFHYDRQLKVYMYALMYPNNETIEQDDYFTAT